MSVGNADFLLQASISNVMLALLLALFALIADRRLACPQVSHLLWLMVLVKLLTPPLWFVPVSWSAPTEPVPYPGLELMPLPLGVSSVGESIDVASAFLLMWLSGSILYAAITLTRVVRFSWVMTRSLAPVTDDIRNLTTSCAANLGLRNVPEVRLTRAAITPMVWSGCPHPILCLPTRLVDELTLEELRWVVAHELAHVRRADHLVRWLEWLARVAFWWNPLVWWAGHSLREAEEICCDQLVLETFTPVPRDYALAIAEAIRLLVQPVAAPIMASPINGSRQLKRRINMMLEPGALMSSRTKLAMAVFAIVALPLAVLRADPESSYQDVQERLDAAVIAGSITQEQAEERWQAYLRKREAGELGVGDDESGEHAGVETRKRDNVAQRRRAIESAVARGEMTEEQAQERLRAVQTHVAEQQRHRDGVEQRLRRIKSAAARGEMTAEEGERARRATREHLAKQSQQDERGAIIERIAAAVAAGEMTEEEAQERRERIRARGKMREQLEQAAREIRELVAAGSMTREEGHEKMQALREEITSQ